MLVNRHIGCGILNTPFSFLGSKVGGCMSRIKSWDEVIDKMVNRLSKWKMKTLSIGGRLTLLKAVFGSMPIYHMSIFKVPMLVLQRMESIRCHFFNGNDLDSKRSIWVSWNKVLTSKEKGGLGVSSLFALNRALMFKWVWRFFNQSDSLWVRVIHAIHGVDGRIGRAGNVGHTSIWCDIIKEMDRLASHGIDLISMMHKKIGNGSNTSFWKDRWRGEQRLKEVFPRIYALEVNKHISVAFKFEQTSLSSSLRRMPRSGIESEQWDHLLDSLEGVMLSPSEDRWSWDLNGSGEFSVASARRYIDNNRLPDISSKTRWIKEVPIKVNVHAWKVRINGLPTRWNISRRGIDIPSILCPLCETGVESSKHLFFNCSVVRAIFRRVCIWWDVSYMELDSFDEWISWITNLRLPSKHKRLLEGVCYGLWWFIWAFRNKKIFGVVPSSKANIFDDLVLSFLLVFSFNKIRRSKKKSTVISRQGSWSLARLRDEMRQSSGTQEYPSLIDTFFVAHTINGEFLRNEDRSIYFDSGGASRSGGCGDDEESAGDQEDEDEDGDGDSLGGISEMLSSKGFKVLDGAFGGVRDEEVVAGEGVVVASSSLEMLTNSCLGGIMVSLIFLEGLEEEG
ncbi:RNA-directed DNA polymerase, eukaryota, reverse transcriptase zinc-binding domain protein [Tanacetum coccineum]|uniref:RNA-directed DNA polymerase, eukaryota, reverse transcriptase zinc-binding domain protein n=1 Tax=Tanacetum coccineum TaxID=301880 RepID=A0ABQ5G0Z2_9ASTR